MSGKDDEVLVKLRENLEKAYPGIQILGMYSPPFRPLTDEEDAAICKEINELKPDFLWVGIGAPKQEMWMWKHQEKIHGTRMLGVGAGFNFFAGTLGGIPRIVIEGKNGFLREPGDVAGFAEAIIEILTNNATRKSMGEKSLEIVKGRYSLEAHIKEIEKVYQMF